jgi:FAD/FMN-containing dehydrogenase
LSKTEQFLADLVDIVGAAACITDEQSLEPHVTEWRDVLHGRALAMVSPDTTRQVAEVVRLCASASIALVP